MKPYKKMSYKEITNFMEEKGFLKEKKELAESVKQRTFHIIATPGFMILAFAFLSPVLLSFLKPELFQIGRLLPSLVGTGFIFLSFFVYYNDIRLMQRDHKKKIITFLHENENNHTDGT